MKSLKKVLISITTAILLIGMIVGCDSPITTDITEVNSVETSVEDSTVLTTTGSITEIITEATTEKVVEIVTERITEVHTEAPTETMLETVIERVPTPETEVITQAPHVHSFSDATCTKAKTCDCGATEGTAKGHNYVNGKCLSCGVSDPNYVSETMVWIPTKGGKKYHTHSGCSNMDNPDYVTKSYAESLGFTPCKRCH